MDERIIWGPAQLAAIEDLTADIRLLTIRPDAGFTVPSPGSHICVAVEAGGQPDIRSYSTLGSAADGLYRIAVKRVPQSRGGSRHIWGLAAGAPMTVSQPRNRFALKLGGPGYLLVAGGIGVTPIYGMALALAAAGAEFRLLYAARSQAHFALADRLHAAVGDRLELYPGDEQRIDLAAAFDRLASGGECYLCGPIGLMDAAKRAWAAAGRPMDRLRFETFGSGGHHATAPFTVKLPRLGLTVEVPGDRTMLEALEAAGVDAMYDCRRGECGLCALPVLAADGVIDHRDVFFSDAEKVVGAKLCACVSRAVGGSVTLDTGLR